MQKFIIKTHKQPQVHFGPHLFILNKGLNSGKPLAMGCSNCFVILFDDTMSQEAYYWLAYSLWKSKFWHAVIVGSVIPFLRIDDFKKHFEVKTEQMQKDYTAHLKNVQALKLLEHKENEFHKNIALINDIRRTILFRYCTK